MIHDVDSVRSFGRSLPGCVVDLAATWTLFVAAGRIESHDFPPPMKKDSAALDFLGRSPRLLETFGASNSLRHSRSKKLEVLGSTERVGSGG